jgi:formamidopyrimidine-DNA glycosylase
MTGWFKFADMAGPDYIESRDAKTPDPDASQTEPEWPPKFTLLEITPSESGAIAFIDARKLSKLRLVTVPEGKTVHDVEPIALNGPDPVQTELKYDYVSGVLKKKKTDIKKLLMDQKFISGVGNWVADDILLHARLHPGAIANTLDEKETRRLMESIKYVCKTAVECGGETRKFPKEWLVHLRWGRGKDAKKGLTLVTGEKVEWLDRGRATAYVPEYQKLKGVVKEDKPRGGKNGEKGGKLKKEEEAKKSGVEMKEEQDVKQEEVEEKARITKKPIGKRKNAVVEKEDAETLNKTAFKKVSPTSSDSVSASKKLKAEPKSSNPYSQTKLSFQPSTSTRRSSRTSKQ